MPLISARPSLGPSCERLHAELLERGGGGHDLAGDVDAAVAHQRGDQMRERREVAEAPTLPCDGISGMASRSSSAWSASMTSGRTPE